MGKAKTSLLSFREAESIQANGRSIIRVKRIRMM
jgi:hypothetical protein